MRTLSKSLALSMTVLMGVAVAAHAALPYLPSPSSQLSAVPSMAPAGVAPASKGHPANWYYDPYTHGSAACPQGSPEGGPKCADLIPPSYPN